MMRRRNGFSMMEMLAVIVVAAVLAFIAIPTVQSIINKAKDQYYKTLEDHIQLSGIDYYADHRNERPKQNLATSQVDLQLLQEQNYLKELVVDDKGKDTCSGFVRALKQSEGKYEYTACLVCDNYKSTTSYCEESYDPSQNGNIYTLDAPDKVYSYYNREIDVDRLEQAIVRARGEEVGRVTALYESVANVDTSVLGTRKDQVKYIYEMDGKTLTATSDLIIYQNQAPNVTLTQCKTSDCKDRYTSNTWTNQNVKETIRVSNYVHGEFVQIQIYNDETKIWETYCTNKSCSKINTVNNNDAWTTSKTVRSIDKEGNVSAEANYQIKIDKIKPQCSLVIASGTKGDNGFYTSNVQVTMTTTDEGSELGQFGILNRSNTTYNGNNRYTITSDGSYRIYGFVKDNAGNTNQCQIGPIKVDKIAPNCPSIKANVAEKTWTNNTIELTITPTNDTKSWTWYTNVNGGEYTQFSTVTGTKKVTFSAEGERQGKIVLMDDAGNSRTCYTGLYYVDKTVPNCPTVSVVRNEKGYPVVLRIKPTSDTVRWTWYTNDLKGGWNKWNTYTSSQEDLSLEAEGVRQGRVVVIDRANNEKTCNTSSYTIDYCDSTDLQYGEWSSCKNGKQTREVKTIAKYNGKTCSSKTEEKSCAPPSHTHVYEILGTSLHKSTHNEPLTCGTVHSQVYYGYCIICWNYGIKTIDLNDRGNPISYCPGQYRDGCKNAAPMYPNIVPD